MIVFYCSSVPCFAAGYPIREEQGVPTCLFRPLGGEESVNPATTVTSVRTCQSYFNSPDIVNVEGGVDELLFGLSRQVTEREDNTITEDLQGFVRNSKPCPILLVTPECHCATV